MTATSTEVRSLFLWTSTSSMVHSSLVSQSPTIMTVTSHRIHERLDAAPSLAGPDIVFRRSRPHHKSKKSEIDAPPCLYLEILRIQNSYSIRRRSRQA
ncbi:hypothetical protein CC86DRAFT_68578 [Ophiobolus disseminans]|uniref:Uncharacterized protein n=1 Tax=Ophiobolus disseminans TaxID=1469910 RepID=A0A6A6ZT60_9PLEO|nr:hypothetical protein CC86DRAFT_68578 [Ophiobolus disseminans]